MSYSRVNNFFYPGNAVHGEPDYGLADNFMRIADDLINTAYHGIRIKQLKDMKSLRSVIISLLLCTTFEIYAKKKQD